MSPLLLDNFYLTRLNISWRPPEKETVDVQQVHVSFDYDLATNTEKPNYRRMLLRIKAEEIGVQQPKVGFIVDTEIAGIFIIPDGTPEDKKEALVRVTGLAMLYGTLRGVLGSMTSSFEQQKLVLPSIDPRAVVETVESRKQSGKSAEHAETSNADSPQERLGAKPNTPD